VGFYYDKYFIVVFVL